MPQCLWHMFLCLETCYISVMWNALSPQTHWLILNHLTLYWTGSGRSREVKDSLQVTWGLPMLLSHKKMCHCISKVSLHSEASVPSLGPHRHFYPQHLLFEKKMNRGCFSPGLKREVGSWLPHQNPHGFQLPFVSGQRSSSTLTPSVIR